MKKHTSNIIAITVAGTLFWTSVGRAVAQDDPAKTPPENKEVAAQKADSEINEVPYIATYYVTPKVNLGEDAAINYYVTDFHNLDYMADDHSLKFAVDYWINNEKTTINDVKAGDQTLTLKSLPKGKVLLGLQVTDEKGRKSHRLFQEFLVVDPAEEAIPEDKIYQPDLQKFGISSDDTHPVETSKGLTEMLKWASDNGYRKVVLPKGRYRLDENNTVQMATRLTLDMNGSTFKLNPSTLGEGIMFQIVNCFDSHVVNGTFEGDLKERDFEKETGNSEHMRAVVMGQDATYCSFENVKVVDVTGYGTVTLMSGAGITNYITTSGKPGAFLPGDIDAKGNAVPSDARMTGEDFVDLTKFKDSFGFFQLGLYLGYQGNPTRSWVYKTHYYDADKKYLETIEGYLYRRMHIPQEAKFARITVYGDIAPEKLQKLRMFDFRLPYNCTFRNVDHINVRCVGMVPSGFVNLLVEGCTFENCGWKAAKCAFDAEDGWDMAQDLMFRNNKFGTNPNSEFMGISGHNFTLENNEMKVSIRNRNYTVRNNKIKSAVFSFGTVYSSGIAARVYNNVIAGPVSLKTKSLSKSAPPYREYCIRDNVCQGGVGRQATKENQNVGYFFKCKIEGGKIEAKVVECDLKNMQNLEFGAGFEIINSTVESSLLKTTHGGSIKIAGSKVTNSQIEPSLGSEVLLENNTLTNVSGLGNMVKQTWTLRGNKVETSLENLLHLEKYIPQLVLENNVITSTDSRFAVVKLTEARTKNLENTAATITGNTFNAKGGTVLDLPVLKGAPGTLTVTFSGNTYHEIDEVSVDGLDSTSVKIVRDEIKKP